MKKLTSILFLLGFIISQQVFATDANTLTLSNFSAKSGSRVVMSVGMKNQTPISALQFDLCLPTGVTVAVEDDFLAVELSTARTTAKKTCH